MVSQKLETAFEKCVDRGIASITPELEISSARESPSGAALENDLDAHICMDALIDQHSFWP